MGIVIEVTLALLKHNSIAFNPCMYGNCMHDTYGHPNDIYKAQIISNVGSLNGNTNYNMQISIKIISSFIKADFQKLSPSPALAHLF